MTTNHARHRRWCSAAPARPAGGFVAAARRARPRRSAPARARGEPPFDWDDRATWAPALRGIDVRVHLLLPRPRAAGRGRDGRRVRRGSPRERRRRLVLLSGRGEPEAQRAEQAVQEAGADWTIVRCSWFSQNFSESFLLEPCSAGDGRAAGRRGRRAVRRRRGHRRRRGRGAHRGRARGPALRADRPAAADVRRGGRARSPARRAAPIRFVPVSVDGVRARR